MTVSIYTTWVARSDLPGAAQIALAMLTVVVCLVALERRARRRRRYANDAQQPRSLRPHRLHGAGAAAALTLGIVPVFVGFVVPAAYLATAATDRIRLTGLSPVLLTETANTVWLSLLATSLTLGCGVVVVYAARLGGGRLAGVFAQTASLGYAIPGSVLAIGLLPVVTGFDAMADGVVRPLLGVSWGLLSLSSGAALAYAYLARFLAVAAGSTEAGFSRISPSIDDAGRVLGAGAGRRLLRIHLPLTRPAIATAGLLVFVDCMKELPATLLLRPLGVETLATHLYGDAVRGTYEDAAIAALLIVLAGLLPVIALARVSRWSDGGWLPGLRP